MRRLDHRGRPSKRMLHDVIDAVNATNTLATAFAAGGEAPVVSANLTHDDTRLCNQYMWTGSNYEPIRGSKPKRTITGIRRLNIHTRAAQMRWWGRGGWGDNGSPLLWGVPSWNGFDTSDVTDTDFLLLGSDTYRLGGSCGYEGNKHVYLDDPFDGYSYPTLNPYLTVGDPLYNPALYVGPEWTTWAADAYDVWSGGSLVYATWGDNWINPVGIGWNHGWDDYDDGEGLIEIYPITLADYGAGGNWVGWASGVTLAGDPGGPASGSSDSAVRATGTPFSFPHFLASCPDGTVVNSARIEVKCTGLVKNHDEYTQDIDAETGTLQTAVATRTVETDGMALALLGGQTVEGDTSRRRQWAVVAAGATSTIATDVWQVVDITDICQAFVDSLRSGRWDSFAFMPSIYAGLVGETDMRSYLNALLPTVTWSYWEDVDWEQAWMGGGDKCWVSHTDGRSVTWTTLELGRVVINFSYPDGEAGRAVSYANAPVMT